MRLLKCKVENFGSYQTLEFDFSNLGLALILGATGSGKSTLQDIAPWVLFGVTAKDGNADEVRNWNNLSAPTFGHLEVETRTGAITITRIRSKGSSNDLFWQEHGSDDLCRGKDIPDTQKRLEQRLGVDAATYLQSSYFHEFSPAAAFFTAKAKDRRKLFESLVSLDFANDLSDRSRLDRKRVSENLKDVEKDGGSACSALSSLESSLSDSKSRSQSWERGRSGTLEALRAKAKAFESEKAKKVQALKDRHQAYELAKADMVEGLTAKIEAISGYPSEVDLQAALDDLAHTGVCNACGALTSEAQASREALLGAIQTVRNELSKKAGLECQLATEQSRRSPFYTQAMDAEQAESPYERQLQDESGRLNPFTAQIAEFERKIVEAESRLSALTEERKSLEHKVLSLTQLLELSDSLRAELLQNSVKRMEAQTNAYLTDYFDSEFRVGFSLVGADDLEITIQKNGNECVYRQLSRGQRQMLKLAFVVSVMIASANKAGTHFSLLCFDESLFGLDPDLKVKAYRLFEQLAQSHESVICVEHDRDFQSLFERRFLVTLVGDTSVLQEADND